MNEEYTLPSGLACCEYYNQFSGESECRIPQGKQKQEKALIEALQQLHLMQRKVKDMERKVG